jgi:hypothetical protein
MNENLNLKRAVEMHREFAALDSSLFLDFDLIENIWTRASQDEINWNSDNNEEDLQSGNGKTYSIETYRGALYEDDDYLLILGDNGCGDKSYYLFLKERELSS